jgi:hypothetical protein
MPHGALTTIAARDLTTQLAAQELDVLYGHGVVGVDPPAQLGKLKAWYGSEYASHVILADLDIAVVSRALKQAYALIEIEETTCKPKVVLGDVMATLLGGNVTFRGKCPLGVGTWTTLIVLAKAKTSAQQERITFLAEQVSRIKARLEAPNAAIGRIVIDSFHDEGSLVSQLRMHVLAALDAAGDSSRMS